MHLLFFYKRVNPNGFGAFEPCPKDVGNGQSSKLDASCSLTIYLIFLLFRALCFYGFPIVLKLKHLLKAFIFN
jgi:hypothetical protein